MINCMKKLFSKGGFRLILPLLLIFALVSCGNVAETIINGGDLEEAILNYIDENVDDYNGVPSEEASDTEELSGQTEKSETDPPIETVEQAETVLPSETDALPETEAVKTEVIREDGVYTSKEDVALYIHTYGKLPKNFITKKDAQALGWEGGSLEPYAPGMCIGGSYFGNYEGLLPEKKGRSYTECDIDTLGKSSRGAKRIVFSNDGLIYYTDDHYESFELLYGDPS